VYICVEHTCYNASGADYYGTVNVGVSGNVCLRWDSIVTASVQLRMTGIHVTDWRLLDAIS